VWPFVALLGLTIITIGLAWKEVTLTDVVMLIGTGYTALAAARNIPTFAIVAAPVLARQLSVLLANHGLNVNTARLPSRGVYGVVNALLVLLAVAAAAGQMIYELSPERVAELRAERLPVAAVEYLNQNEGQGALFNSYNWGGYIIWEARDYPVYVDGRTDLYGDGLLTRFLHVWATSEGWEDTLRDDTIEIVLIEPFSPLAAELKDSVSWEVVQQDDVSVMFVRRKS